MSALAAAASSLLPLKHDTGFECDRLMIGCSALSPAYRSARAEEAGTYGYLHLLFPGTLNECLCFRGFLNKLDMRLGRCSVYVLLTCRVFSVLYFVF